MEIEPIIQIRINDNLDCKFRDELESFLIDSIKTLDNITSSKATLSLLYYFRNFLIDLNGKREQSRIPIIKNYFLDVLGEDYDDVLVKKHKQFTVKCFNCGGPHIVTACLLPLDFKQIALNKASYLTSSLAQSFKNRYHTDIPPKYSHFKPGILSKELIKALELSKFEMPPYIYTMRELSYPPGHFIDATQHSGINLSDKHDPNDEDYYVDIHKVIDYPGFNITPSKNIQDNPHFLPMQTHHFKEKWIQKINETKRLLNNGENLKNGDEEFGIKDSINDAENNNIVSDFSNSLEQYNNSQQNSEEVLKKDTTDINISANVLNTTQFSLKGTPVTKKFYVDKLVPNLDKFSADIQPFSYDDFHTSAKKNIEKEMFLKIKNKVSSFKNKRSL